MQCYTHTLPGGASLVGYLRDSLKKISCIMPDFPNA